MTEVSTICFECFHPLAQSECRTHRNTCSRKLTEALDGLLTTAAKQRRSKSGSGLCTFQTPVRSENCLHCEASLSQEQLASHLFECIGTTTTAAVDAAAASDAEDAAPCVVCHDPARFPLRLSHCGHVACRACLLKQIAPAHGPARLAIDQRCPSCAEPVQLVDLIALTNEAYVWELFYAALHDIAALAAMRKTGFDCPSCMAHVVPSRGRAAKRTFKAACDVLCQQCPECSASVCLACQASLPAGAPVHASAKAVCLQARLFVALQALAHLSKHVGVSPDGEVVSAQAALPASPSQSSDPAQSGGIVWSSGTGYGSGYGGGYDDYGNYGSAAPVADSPWQEQAAQLQKVDRYVADILQMLSKALTTSAAQSLPAAFAFLFGSSSLMQPLIRSYLKNDSFDDVCLRQGLYGALFDFIRLLSGHPALHYILGTSCSPSVPSIATMLAQLQKKLPIFLAAVKDSPEEQFLAQRLLSLALPFSAESDAAAGPSSSAAPVAATSTASLVDYVTLMKPFQFAESESPIASVLQPEAGAGPTGRPALRRLARELDSLISDSFISSGKTSILVRVDKTCLHLYRIIITGPSETPYSYGCFEFEVYCPASFPDTPPKARGLTNGNGTVRFNPNLYDNGYVCLSLLGTWSGSSSEMWNREVSSLAQVLVSIQSFILGSAKPYYNEPSYESYSNEAASEQYNQERVVQTLRWAIVDQLKNPNPDFAAAIKAHLNACREEINKYYSAFYSSDHPSHPVVVQLLEEFNQLVVS